MSRKGIAPVFLGCVDLPPPSGEVLVKPIDLLTKKQIENNPRYLVSITRNLYLLFEACRNIPSIGVTFFSKSKNRVCAGAGCDICTQTRKLFF